MSDTLQSFDLSLQLQRTGFTSSSIEAKETLLEFMRSEVANVVFDLSVGQLLGIEIHFYRVFTAQMNTHDAVGGQHLLFDIHMLTWVRHLPKLAFAGGQNNELWSYFQVGKCSHRFNMRAGLVHIRHTCAL